MAEKTPIYVTDLKGLSGIGAHKEETVVLVNLLSIDDLLHTDVESAATTYEVELYRLFMRIAEVSFGFFERCGVKGEDFGLYVITDHGSTMILDEEMSALESKVVQKLFPDERQRYGSIPAEEVNSIPENLWALGFKFSKPFAEDPVFYFVPSGHNTVKTGRNWSRYVHGGATPEEVIVPMAVFRPVQVSYKKPLARFVDLDGRPVGRKLQLFVKRLTLIGIEVQNINPDRLAITRIDVLSPSADVRSATLVEVPPFGKAVVSIYCYFEQAALTADQLVIQLTYRIGSEIQRVTTEMGTEFKSVAASGINLRDLARKGLR